MRAQNTVSSLLVELWDQYAPVYAASFGQLRVFQGFARKMEGYLLPVPGGVVLDGGCGPGLNFASIIQATNPARLIGLDISPKMLEKANKARERLSRRHRCEINLQRADLCEGIPYPDNTFDAQVYQLVLYYLPGERWREVIKEAYRVAKPGGYIVSSNALRRFDFRKEIGIRWLIGEVLLHPMAVFLAMRKVRPIMTQFQDLEKEGSLSYPSLEELIGTHEQVGFQNITSKYIWKTNMVMVRAHKPE